MKLQDIPEIFGFHKQVQPVGASQDANAKDEGFLAHVGHIFSDIGHFVLNALGFHHPDRKAVKVIPVEIPPKSLDQHKMEVGQKADQIMEEIRRNRERLGILPPPPTDVMPKFGSPEVGQHYPLPHLANNDWGNFAPKAPSSMGMIENANMGRIQAAVREVNTDVPDTFEKIGLKGYESVVEQLENYVEVIKRSPGNGFENKKLPIKMRNAAYEYLEKTHKGDFVKMRKDLASLEKDVNDLKELTSEINTLTYSEEDPDRLKKLKEEKRELMWKMSPEIHNIDDQIGELLGGVDLAGVELNQAEMNKIATDDAGLYEKLFELQAQRKGLEDSAPASHNEKIVNLKSVLRAVPLLIAKAEDTSELERLAYLKFKKQEIQNALNGDLTKSLHELDERIEEGKEELEAEDISEEQAEKLREEIDAMKMQKSRLDNFLKEHGKDFDKKVVTLEKTLREYDDEIARLKAALSI